MTNQITVFDLQQSHKIIDKGVRIYENKPILGKTYFPLLAVK